MYLESWKLRFLDALILSGFNVKPPERASHQGMCILNDILNVYHCHYRVVRYVKASGT